jgi:hypothetical protein
MCGGYQRLGVGALHTSIVFKTCFKTVRRILKNLLAVFKVPEPSKPVPLQKAVALRIAAIIVYLILIINL